jgi:hypothetical protein
MIGMDYGNEGKLRLHTATGPMEVPLAPKGTSGAQKFAFILETLLDRDDVATESPTVGSSGAEAEAIRDIVANAKYRLFAVSPRVVKNTLKDNGVVLTPQEKDEASAKIIYDSAVDNPDSLQVWRYRSADDKLHRRYTSVRPYDKRNYKDPVVDRLMANLPPFGTLPAHLQDLFTNKKKRSPDYARARALPFAMALEEPGADSRAGYEKILGLYAHGYPSFYRRATVNLMQRVAKELAQTKLIAEVSREQRKEAQKITRRAIRELYHLSRAHSVP